MYKLYMLCLNCGCTDLYQYSKRRGVLLSIWKNDDVKPKVGPTVCDHCHSDFPDIDVMQFRMDVLTDITEELLLRCVADNAHMKVTYSPKLMPQPALLHQGQALPISIEVLPDLAGAHGIITKNINNCSAHQ